MFQNRLSVKSIFICSIIRNIFFSVVVLTFLCSCSEQSSSTKEEVIISKEGVDLLKADYDVVEIFYGTDRKINENSKITNDYYTGERGDFSYGTCQVSIPKGHQAGELETPSVFKFQFSEDPALHVVLLEVNEKNSKDYFTKLASEINGSNKKQAFVFIHGYNVAFAKAARRTAQIKYDLNFEGAAIFYSWPSIGTLAGYPKDEGNVEWTEHNLQKFIKDVISKTGAENIYLIAHSMGNRALTSVLTEANSFLTKDQLFAIKEIILTAPDIDAEIFKRDIAPRMRELKTNITLYVSNKDKALEASRKFKGYSRVGDSTETVAVIQGIETIDASDVSTSFLAHSYYGEETSVLRDIKQLIIDGLNADRRDGLYKVSINESPSMPYWKISLQPK